MMQDTDLAGPLVFCLAFGGSLMLVNSILVLTLIERTLCNCQYDQEPVER